MGATAIGHISFPRHMAMPTLAARREAMAAAAERAGLLFHDITSYDPMGDGGPAGSQLYILQNMPQWVATYGRDTVFFSTNCGQQIPLLQQILNYGGLFVQPCDPSPFHAFPSAFGLASQVPSGLYDAHGEPIMMMVSINDMIEMTRAAVAEAGMTGRLSNWGIPAAMAFTTAAFYYAVEWMHGSVPTEPGAHPDINVINRLIGDYMYAQTGERMYMDLLNLTIGATVFPMYIVGTSPYILY